MNKTGYKIRRLIAYAVDWYISFLLLIIFNALYSTIRGVEVTYFATVERYTRFDAIFVLIVMLIIHIIYFVVFPIIFNGRTIGKMIVKQRIVSNSGEKAKVTNLLVRQFVVVILIEGYLSPIGSYLRTYMTMYYGNMMMFYRIWLGITIVSVGLGMYTKENKLIHDFIGKTKVINI